MLAYSLWESIFRMPQIAVIMGCLVPIAAILGSFWYKVQKVRSENDLNLSMLKRGMSDEEIERVISAGVEDDPE